VASEELLDAPEAPDEAPEELPLGLCSVPFDGGELVDAEFGGLLVAVAVDDGLLVAEAVVFGLTVLVGLGVGVWVGQPIGVALAVDARLALALAFAEAVEATLMLGLMLGLAGGLVLALGLTESLLEGLLAGPDGLGGVDAGVALGRTDGLAFALAEADGDGGHAVDLALLWAMDELFWLRPPAEPAPPLPGPVALGAPLVL
jgi:hypothetical protein